MRKFPPLAEGWKAVIRSRRGSTQKIATNRGVLKTLSTGVRIKQKLKDRRISYFDTHNINSITKVGRLKTLTNISDKEQITIRALPVRNSGKDLLESHGYRLFLGIPGKRAMKQFAQFGCGFLLSLKTINSILDFKLQSSKIVTLNFKTPNKIYTVINGMT